MGASCSSVGQAQKKLKDVPESDHLFDAPGQHEVSGEEVEQKGCFQDEAGASGGGEDKQIVFPEQGLGEGGHEQEQLVDQDALGKVAASKMRKLEHMRRKERDMVNRQRLLSAIQEDATWQTVEEFRPMLAELRAEKACIGFLSIVDI